MKTKVFLFVSTIITAVVILLGCQKKPTACFNASSTNIIKGQSVSFTNCSTDGHTYKWDFDDGTYSNEQSPPAHSYYTTGKYDVTLTVYSKGEKKSEVATVTITVDCSTPTANNTSGATGTTFIASWSSDFSSTYFLDVATDAAFSNFVSGYNNLNVGSSNMHQVTGLICNTTYYYRVRSCSAINSNVISVTTSWEQKANFGGTARFGAVGFSIGTKGYIGTGNNATNLYKDFFEWDQISNVWTQKATFGGTARYNAVGFSIGTKGYIGTGFDASAAKQDFWEWDQATNVWTQKANFGGTAREEAVGFSIGTKGYIGTGYDGTVKQDFWEWNQSTNVWTQKANFGGTARNRAVGFSIGTKGYIGTGSDVSGLKQDFWEWDQTSNMWTQKATVGGTGRYLAVGFSIGTKGYIGTGSGSTLYMQDFWEWDQATNTWTQKGNFSGTARRYATGFSIGTKGYIGTGTDGNFSYPQDFLEYCQ